MIKKVQQVFFIMTFVACGLHSCYAGGDEDLAHDEKKMCEIETFFKKFAGECDEEKAKVEMCDIEAFFLKLAAEYCETPGG